MTDDIPRSIAILLSAEPQTNSVSSLIIKIVLLFLLILVNAFFAMSEIAVISLNDNKMEKLADEGNKKAKQIIKLTENSSGFLSTIQIGVTLAGFLTSASASQSFAPMIAEKLAPILNMKLSTVTSVASVVITLVMSYFSLVLGELVPKKLAMAKPEKISFAVVGFLLFFSKCTKPFVKLLSLSTNAVVRLFGMDPNADTEQVTEEEILMLVDAGEEKGVIENSQAEMINNIFEFDDLDAGDIMTHRVDMSAVDADEGIDNIISEAIEEGYSRIPVYQEDQDNIIGIVYVKDLLKYVGKNLAGDLSIRDIMREAYFIPESKKCGELLREMIERHIQMAIVVDEYGGTAGLVTFEDLIESIIGNVQDEYDDEEEEISKINDNIYTIDGTTDLDEVDELVGAKLPMGDYDTVAGFIIAKLGYLPQDGNMDVCEFENLKFTVLSVDGRRIDKVKIEILPRE